MNFIEQYSLFIFVALGLIAFFLSIFLGITLTSLREQKKKQNDYKEKFEAELKKQDYYFKDSIITICKATIQGQCEFSEACIRIKKLLEYYPDIESKKEYKVIQEMYDEIKHFSTHAERLSLPKKEIFNQDKLRFSLEAKYEQDFRKSLEILQKDFEVLI
ncbi:MAG: cbb3-type cytochrome oxidase subunit 3 [Bacteriovoracaceae bacterium]|jgi:cbb3-type cytochrome oxidase subunit 3